MSRREHCPTARKINGAAMDAQDRALQHATGTRFGRGRSFRGGPLGLHLYTALAAFPSQVNERPWRIDMTASRQGSEE